MPTLRRWDGAKLADVAAGWAVEARKVDDRRFANTDEALGAELCLAARGFVLAFAKTRRDAQDFAEKLAKWAPPPPAEHAKPLRAAAALARTDSFAAIRAVRTAASPSRNPRSSREAPAA